MNLERLTMSDVYDALRHREAQTMIDQSVMWRFEPPGIIFDADEQPHALSEEAQKQLLSSFGIPFKFFNECPAEIQGVLINTFREHNPSPVINMMIQAGVIEYVTFKDLNYIHPTLVLDRVVDAYPRLESLDLHHYRADPREISMAFTTPDISKEMKPGDIVNAGISIRYSDVSKFAPTVGSYLNRLICTNGMRASVGDVKIKLSLAHDENLFLDQIQDHIRLASGRLESMLEQLQKTTEIKIPVNSMLNRVIEENNLAGKTGDMIYRRLEDGEGTTLYDAINAITAAANHMDNLRQREHLQTIAFDVMNQMSHRRCDHCYSLLG